MKKMLSALINLSGLGFMLYGLFSFVTSSLYTVFFFLDKPLWARSIQILSSYFLSPVIVGIPPSQAPNVLDNIEMLLSFDIFFVLVHFVFIPASGFLLFLAGLGILRRYERWRRSIVVVSAIAAFLKFMEEIYTMGTIIMLVVVGRIMEIEGRDIIPAQLRNGFGIFQQALIRDFLIILAILAIVAFFFTRPKVKEQFK